MVITISKHYIPKAVMAAQENPSQTEMTCSSTGETDGRRKAPTMGQLGGAAVVGGAAALALGCGPLLALAAAGRMAATTTSKGATGEVARLGGGAVASTGKQIQKFSNKHQLAKKTAKGVWKIGRAVLETDPLEVAIYSTVVVGAGVCAIADMARGKKIQDDHEEEDRPQ